MNEGIKKDIQYLLLMYECYIEDMGGAAWENEKFINLTKKYGFNEDNLHIGFEHLCC
jgi:DNA-binding transcriptional regulator PaaX